MLRTGHTGVITATTHCQQLAPLVHSQGGTDEGQLLVEGTDSQGMSAISEDFHDLLFFQTAWFSPNCLPSIHSSTIPSPQETDKTECISIYMKALGNSIMFLLFYCRWHTNFSLLLQKAPEPCGVQ